MAPSEAMKHQKMIVHGRDLIKSRFIGDHFCQANNTMVTTVNTAIAIIVSMAAGFAPSKRAMSLSALEAIRNN